MTKVVLKADEPVEVALRRFRREIQKTGLIQELRARGAYEKPTTQRKRKLASAVSRQRARLRRAKLPPKLY
ncbi:MULTISPECIES: 30S ribosomal protein S21 [Burkholderia]|uniref:Small ribosomal subunit protein bS21 n=1 Tax=Burkholderia gladioli (strain BSR3) TaxID=999541 RepID=F2LIG9_BURGS|nr:MULTISPECIES: 30S ribosomal protein S21 [Burkholderia]AEA62548.1 30S ribosomal protein S21P [Burkholderia gladioli BSR3]MBW5280769.1 30S ribosomal protein S21 [Burkholderia gladioli]NHH82868.1 30S ribosomal protein S21 [Burkholderia gladioli]NIE82589.1 30S ribosomal protein S21 [Burkholderia sp. Tr-860]NIF61973.1 30S ribosomal protein S21 [Burkholderia sp. Cy-647]